VRVHLNLAARLTIASLLVLVVAVPPAGATGADAGVPAAAPAAVAPTAFVPGNIHLSFSRIAHGLSQPVFATTPPADSSRLFVVEQTGRIRLIRKGVLQSTPFLDLRAKVSTGGERGLLGLAFHPDYNANGKFYVDYTDRNGNTVVEQYRRSATNFQIASPSAKLIFRITQPYANHNGGMLAFGPDRYLYVGMGDGGSAGDPGNRAQNINSLLGKILRVNIDTNAAYAIPPTNPYVGRDGSDLVWSIGLRNPWRFSFDRLTGDLWIGDVGQDRYEEIDRSKAPDAGRGVNYGWRVLEGTHCYNPPTGCSTAGKTMPIATYTHSVGCSVTGGYVYRGSAYPDLRGVYIFGDYCSGRIWGLDAAGANSQTPTLLYDAGANISSFGEDNLGNLYLVDRNGDIWLLKDV
jgi:glucose/arabinose dehydrogenase